MGTTTCANCADESLFEYKLTDEVSIHYCGKHLPKFLDARKKAGLLHTTDSFSEVVEEAMEVLAPEEETEEVNTEDSPTPKKKAVKKKAE